MSAALQSREDERACGMQARVSELEALVCAACGRGVEAARCRDVIEETVRRARRKGAMLQHLDSSLLLSTLEQAKSEIASLTDVAATNAEVMQEELLHHQERQEERGAEDSEDVTAASVVSLPASSIAAPSSAAASSEAAAPSSPTGQQAEDSPGRGSGPRAEYPPALEGLLSAGSRASAGSAGMGGGVGSGALAPRTPHGGGGWLAPADVVAPLRDFASEVAAEAAVEIEEVRSFRHSMSMRAPRREEAERVASYDFDAAMSPRASYHVRDAPFQPHATPELVFSFGRSQMDTSLDEAAAAAVAAGEQLADEEGGEDEAGSPLLVYSRTPDAAAPGRRESLDRYFSAVETVEEEEEGQEGEASEGAAGTAAPEQSAAAALLPALARPFSPPRPLGSPRPYSPRGRRLSDSAIPSPWMQAQRQQMERQRSRSAGEAHCWSAMPPGFYPGAAVEGSAFQAAAALDRDTIDPSSPTGVGALDLESYNSAPFTLHSVTPPRHVMAELAAEVQGRLRM